MISMTYSNERKMWESMKKLSRVISAILIASMLSTGVYATEMPDADTNGAGSEPKQSVEKVTPENTGEDSGSSVEGLDDDIATVETKAVMDYIKDLKLTGAELKDGKVKLDFSWTLADAAVVPAGYNVYLSETKLSGDKSSFGDAKQTLGADALSVSFEGLSKGQVYYIAVEPYSADSTTDGQIKLCSGIYIDTPKISKVTAADTSATVTFTKVSGATGYTLVNETLDNKETAVAADKTSVTVKGLSNNKKYTFRIKALYEKDGISQKAVSDAVSATTKVTVPKKPSLSKLEPYNKGAILKWSKVSGATSYEVYRYYNKKWSKIETVKGAVTYKNTGLKTNKEYKYRVIAVRTVNGKSAKSSWSNTRKITAKKYLTGDIRIGYSEGVLMRPAKKYKEGSSTKLESKSTLASGTRITIIKTRRVSGKTMAYIKTKKSGKTYWIRRGNISFYAPYRTLDYTTQAKEDFVNRKGYSSKSKYLVFICHYTQRTYIFKGKKGHWKQIHNFRIAGGKASTRTPLGKFKVIRKRWHSPTSSAMYVTYFTKGGNSFHSRPAGLYTIGRPVSNGCVRMYTNDAKYIYNTIPKKTTVISY